MAPAQNGAVRVGIAGLGRSGWNLHAEAIADLPERFRIVAVADSNPARQREAADRFGCRPYPDFDPLVKDEKVELLVVATPTPLHAGQAVAALRAGKNVVCEKPLATCVADADRMIAAAKKADRMLTVFQSQRYAPDFLKVREVIASGKLGRIVLIRIAIHGFGRRWDWQTLKEFGGGSLNNTGSHFLDQALLLFGEPEPEIFCQLERTLAAGDAEDHCKVILHAPDAPTIDLEITSACAYPQDLWLVMGTRGGLTGSGGRLQWKYVDFDKLPARPVDRNPTPDRSYNAEQLPWKETTWERPADTPAKKGIPFYKDLYETLRQGAPLAITPESVRRQIAALEKCHQLAGM